VVPCGDARRSAENDGGREEEEKKPPLTMLLGAGGSVELGVPSTEGLTRSVEEALGSFRPPDEAAFRGAVDTLLDHCRGLYGDGLTFEQLLHVLETAETLDKSWRLGKGWYPAAEALLSTGPRPNLAQVFDPVVLGRM
jgi:hypothetical protein